MYAAYPLPPVRDLRGLVRPVLACAEGDEVPALRGPDCEGVPNVVRVLAISEHTGVVNLTTSTGSASKGAPPARSTSPSREPRRKEGRRAPPPPQRELHRCLTRSAIPAGEQLDFLKLASLMSPPLSQPRGTQAGSQHLRPTVDPAHIEACDQRDAPRGIGSQGGVMSQGRRSVSTNGSGARPWRARLRILA